MKILIHDLDENTCSQLLPKTSDKTIISQTKRVRPCVDCDDCWLKMPGDCPIQDDLKNIVRTLSTTEELILVSKCVYGGPSPFVKMVLDRMRGYTMPFLDVEENVSRYRLRYKDRVDVCVYFYGKVSEEEKGTAKEFAERFANTYGASSLKVFFAAEMEELGELLNENSYDQRQSASYDPEK
jgi:multimeric flavodoxin WrbA